MRRTSKWASERVRETQRRREGERESSSLTKIGVSMQVIHSFDSLHATHIQTQT